MTNEAEDLAPAAWHDYMVFATNSRESLIGATANAAAAVLPALAVASATLQNNVPASFIRMLSMAARLELECGGS